MSIKEADKEAMNIIQGQMLNKQRSKNTLALVKRSSTNEISHRTNKSLANLDMSDLNGINSDTMLNGNYSAYKAFLQCLNLNHSMMILTDVNG